MKRFVVPVSTRIHSEDGVVDAAKIVRQGQFGVVPQVPARTRLVDLEHSAVGIVYHLRNHQVVRWGTSFHQHAGERIYDASNTTSSTTEQQ